MKTLNQYLSEAKGDYTHACVKVYRPDRKTLYRQISGDINFVSDYVKKNKYGSMLILSGRFSPMECHIAGFLGECTCTYRMYDSRRNPSI